MINNIEKTNLMLEKVKCRTIVYQYWIDKNILGIKFLESFELYTIKVVHTVLGRAEWSNATT